MDRRGHRRQPYPFGRREDSRDLRLGRSWSLGPVLPVNQATLPPTLPPVARQPWIGMFRLEHPLHAPNGWGGGKTWNPPQDDSIHSS